MILTMVQYLENLLKTQSKIPQSLWFHAVCSQLLGPKSFKFWYFLNLLYL